MKFFLLFVIITVFSIMVFSCSDNGSGPDTEGTDGQIEATLSSIQANVFTPNCANSSCHGGSQTPNLSNGQTYNNLVNKASAQRPSLLRVKPGDSANSYLLKKLNGDGTSVMPPAGKLSQETIAIIAEWIDNGAENN